MITASMRTPRALTTGVTVQALMLYNGPARDDKQEAIQIAYGNGCIYLYQNQVRRLRDFLEDWLSATTKA